MGQDFGDDLEEAVDFVEGAGAACGGGELVDSDFDGAGFVVRVGVCGPAFAFFPLFWGGGFGDGVGGVDF